MEYKVYEDSAECLSALKDGSADAIICSYPTAAWMLNQVVSSSYAMSALNSYSCELDGAVPKGNILLWSILNKAIVSSNDFDEIMNSNTRPQTNLFTMVSRLPARLIIAFGIIMLFLAICSLYALILVLHRQHERNAAAAKKSEYEARQAKLAIIEKNNEDKNQFFSNISHDMRTPLNAIIGFSAMGEKETDISKLKEYLYKIQTSGRLLLELINDTLTISKINNGKYNLNPAPVDVYKLIDESSVSIIEAAKIKKVNLKIMRPAQNRIIIADGLALQKIFLNLLSNAVKFTPAGGNVKISFEQIPSGISVPDTLCTVTDSGIGISEEFLPHIYEPFAQETFSSSKSAGTGLGLSIVKQLVDMMGGTIDVSSTLNIGTTFTLRFHFDTAPMENADDSHVNTDYSVENLAGKKMLVCEDNELNREIACAMLNSFGIKTFFAENGRDGVDAFLKSSCYEYSAILMDLRMPVMDGMEAARAIRKSDRPDAITVPIIAMTADAFDDDVKKCLVSGMNAHIAKPLEPSRVKEVLCHYVKNA
jgi:signal transduction histidine kinase/CheY-like chemotaxis protein